LPLYTLMCSDNLPPDNLPIVILDRPQLAQNIGAVARIMANFGLSDLRLIAPRDGWPQDQAWASSSGAHWPLDGARVFANLAEAVADLHIIYATTARNREVQLPVITPRLCADKAYQAQQTGLKTGFLFGGERAGLETQDLSFVHYLVTIPVDTRFSSLNLAQAVAVLAYEYRLQVDDAPKAAFTDVLEPPAASEHLQGLYGHLEAELEKSGFFFPVEKTAQMQRNLRIALGRAKLTEQEVRTWRGVITALARGRGRVLKKLSELKKGDLTD
jgi:tRNA/rRNA methyltransferase